MRWVVAGVPGGAERVHEIAASIGAEETTLSDDVLRTAQDGSGIVVVGTDHDLARSAVRAKVPIAFVPTGESDLARMFALDGTGHLATGAPYPADLGFVDMAGEEHPFVAHAVVSRRGTLPGPLARRREISLDRGRGTERVMGTAVVVANAQHVSGSTVAPRSALMDGVADLQVLGHGGRVPPRLLRRGLHLGRGAVLRRRASRVDVAPPPSWSVTTDGVAVGRGTCTIRIEQARYVLWV